MPTGPILVFACRWCSLLGAERAARERLPLPDGLRLVPVECAGSVSAEAVIESLLNGAAGVAVLGCHLGGCRHNDANRDAHARLEALGALLDAAGLDSRRLLISWGDAHEAKGYAETMRSFAQALQALPAYHASFEVPAQAAAPAPRPLPPDGSGQDAALREAAAAALAEGKLVLGLKASPAGPLPALFSSEEGLGQLTAAGKSPIAKTAWRLLRDQAAGALVPGNADLLRRLEARERLGEKQLAVACRACDARALRQLASMGQLSWESLSILRIACSPEQKAWCSCSDASWPEEQPEQAPAPEAPDAAANAELWQKEFSRCVQCHWCQRACPVCVCPSCSVETNSMLPLGFLPPAPLGYHLARAMHVADACVNCGACQDACPQGLPLLLLHKAVRRSLDKAGYAAGHGQEPPMLRQRLLADRSGNAAPRWGSGLPINETPGR
jgi:coenzyme F420-reducing hydrogenase delta subunit/ferredoxin